MNLKKAWESYCKGDPISDEELGAMIAQAKDALVYFEDRGPDYHLAKVETILSLSNLQRIKMAREVRKS